MGQITIQSFWSHFKVRLILGFRKTPKPYELYNRYHQEFHAPHCDRGHGQVGVDQRVDQPVDQPVEDEHIFG